MTDREQNLLQRVREKLPRFRDGGIVKDSDDPFKHRMPLKQEPRYNPWAIQMAKDWREWAASLEAIAERVDEDDSKQELRGIAAALREEAEANEDLYYD